MSERCETCRFWKRNDYGDPTTVGVCRRYPPVLLQTRTARVGQPTPGDDYFRAEPGEHPEVYADDWCGEFQPIVTPGTPAPAGSERHTPAPPGSPPRGR